MKEQRNQLHNKLFEALPGEFDRKTYCDIAEQLGLNAKSIDRTVKKWCEEGRIENYMHGKYRKI